MSRARRATTSKISYEDGNFDLSSSSDNEDSVSIVKNIVSRAKRKKRISEGKVADSDEEDDGGSEEVEFEGKEGEEEINSKRSSECDFSDEDFIKRPKKYDSSTRQQPSRSSRNTKSLSETELMNDSVLAEIPKSSKEKIGNSISVHPIRQASPRKKQNISLHVSAAEEMSSASSGSEDDSQDSDDEVRVERIIASKCLRKSEWIKVCENKRTSEIINGTRFLNDESAPTTKEDDVFEERFLVKWYDLSYLHCSWETEPDLMNQNDNFATLKRLFFKKSVGGCLFSVDERGDGEFFDPNYCEIDRLLEIVEDDDTEELIINEKDANFQNGRGRQLLVKWRNLGYAASSYEHERDLIWNDVEFTDHVEMFKKYQQKPSKNSVQQNEKIGENERRKLYKIFGDVAKSGGTNENKAEFMKSLQSVKYKNGGSVRDYQAEGIAWMLSSYINKRGGILADEMGLGKTLQTVSFVNYLKNTLKKDGPYLIIAPLSTIPHWQREFVNWTDLNTIIYHGSAEDREYAREFEFAYEEDRPGKVAPNRSFLKACHPRNYKSWQRNWSIDVVITTPEMLIAEDFQELSHVSWEVLVVDEAHRMKSTKSKLGVNLKSNRFDFKHKLLLTGTPIQNNMAEMWCLMNIIDSEAFSNQDAFLEKYGDMKDKEAIDSLHDLIRPYILRRLKEDVEKSVPPKEETIIEVELTSVQKQYYRALYEKNISFLNKKNKKSLDGPSLMNLAMELRKCCNHTFLIKGAENTLRKAELASLSNTKDFNEAEFLVKASGKLVLLDKLLPHLKANGHRVLMFSQFKIMLDIIEDYLELRQFKFERIDGSITGLKRQRAIDRYQAPLLNPSGDQSKAPFIMLISTKAGGVGINLTAADTCIIFDSDWNPQSDLQAQARCHRIGQTKRVQVYRLVSRKTYEMQMFHMASLKMGLDQAVLHGIENNGNSCSEGDLSKDEIEKLLRHGAYEIFTEGNDTDSSKFAEASIESILESNAKRVVHENTGSESRSKGGTFSKASFKVENKGGDNNQAEVDIDDPDFWTKMLGEAKQEKMEDLSKSRKRRKVNYNLSPGESSNDDEIYADDGEVSSSSDADDSPQKRNSEKLSWGGDRAIDWKRSDAILVLELLSRHGYNDVTAAEDEANMIGNSCKPIKDRSEVRRFVWSLILYSLTIVAKDRTTKYKALVAKQHQATSLETAVSSSNSPSNQELVEKYFDDIFLKNKAFLTKVIDDANKYAQTTQSRSDSDINIHILGKISSENTDPVLTPIDIAFSNNLWPQLQSRGWNISLKSGSHSYTFANFVYPSTLSVLKALPLFHPELKAITDHLLQTYPSQVRTEPDPASTIKLSNPPKVIEIERFLHKYAPLQLIDGKESFLYISVCKRIIEACSVMHSVRNMIRRAHEMKETDTSSALFKMLSPIINNSNMPSNEWSIKADCTLLLALSRHGWVDNKLSYKSLLLDDTLSWGPPFELDNEKSSEVKNSSFEEFLKAKKESAMRMVHFLNHSCIHDKVLRIEHLKHFDFNLLSKVYGLLIKSLPEQGNSYEIDDSILRKHSEEEFKNLDTTKDIPPCGILARRTKHLISAFAVYGNSYLTNSEIDDEVYNGILKYSTLNIKRESTDMFLYSLLSNALRMQQSEVPVLKALLEAAKIEAEHRFKSSNKKVYGDIISHLSFILPKIYKHGIRLCKNVVRVILKLDPITGPRGSAGCNLLFPPEDKVVSKPLVFAELGKQKSPKTSKIEAKKKRKKEGKHSIAEAIIAKSMKSKKSSKIQNASSTSTVMAVSTLEALLLSVLVSQGFPVFNDNWQSLVNSDVASTDENDTLEFVISFHGMAQVLAFAAKEWCKLSQIKLANAQCDLNKVKQQLGDTSKAVKALAACEADYNEKIELVTEIDDAVRDLNGITVRSIALIEEMRRHMGNIYVSQHPESNVDENGLGQKVLEWLQRDLQRWTSALSCKEAVRKPTPRPPRVIAAELDSKNCRAIFTQIAQQTRLRSIVLRNGIFRINKLTVKAVKSSEQVAKDVWEQRPKWWKKSDLGSGDDSSLLTNILTCGYSGFDPKRVFDGRSNDLVSLTKANLQPRIYHLTRELSSLQDVEEHQDMFQSQVDNSGKKRKKNLKAQQSLGSFLKPRSKVETIGNCKSNAIDVDTDSLSPAKKTKLSSRG